MMAVRLLLPLLATLGGCSGDRLLELEAGAGGDTSSTGEPLPSEPVSVSIDLSVRHQTLIGFGASLAWYGETLLAHPESETICEEIFGGLGLDIIRLRNRYGRADGFDFAAERSLLTQAEQSLGRRPKVLLTSWSPPAGTKANAETDCRSNTDCTLKQTYGAFAYDEFADYWYDSLVAYRQNDIIPDWISIQNEPDYIPPSWEGCRFEPSETADYPGYAEALERVSTRLSALPEPPGFLGPEVLGIHWNHLQDYYAAVSFELLSGVAHHLYEMGGDGVWDWKVPGPASYSDEMQLAGQLSATLPLFQTEFQTDQDGFTGGGFETAWLIIQSLVEEGTAAWLYWDLVWPDSGLVALPQTRVVENTHVLRDQYFALKHFSYFTDPGFVRVGTVSASNTVLSSAFVSVDGKQVTLIVLNAGDTERTLKFDFGDFVATKSQVYRTTFQEDGNSERWLTEAPVESGDDVALPVRSILTVVLQ